MERLAAVFGALGCLCSGPAIASPPLCDPQLVATLNLPEFGSLVERDGAALSWSKFSSTVIVLDVNDPAAPMIKGKLTLAALPQRVAIDPHAIAIRPKDVPEVWLFDPADLASPPTALAVAANSGIAVDGERLYLAAANEVSIYDIADLSTPVFRATFCAVPASISMRMDARGGLLVAVGLDYKARVFDVSDPLVPVLHSEFLFNGPCNGGTLVAPRVLGNNVLVGTTVSYCGDLRLFDVASPGEPVPLSYAFAPGLVSHDIDESVLAAVSIEIGSGQRPRLFDVQSPTMPLRYEWALEQVPTSIALTGHHALILVASELRVYRIEPCPGDCDCSGMLEVDDFACFQTNYAMGVLEADCDKSGGLDIDDFICFQTLYAIGC